MDTNATPAQGGEGKRTITKTSGVAPRGEGESTEQGDLTMEGSLSSRRHHHRLAQGPSDTFRHPLDMTSRPDSPNGPSPTGLDRPRSWGSGAANGAVPLEDFPHGMDGRAATSDEHTVGHGVTSTAPEPKKKRFVCPRCTRAFARSGHLQRHGRSRIKPVTEFGLMVDTNERPFQCPQCSSAFGRLDTLLRHERTLHGFSSTAASNNPPHRRMVSISAATPNPDRSNLTTTPPAHTNNPLQTELDPLLTTIPSSSSTQNIHPSSTIPDCHLFTINRNHRA